MYRLQDTTVPSAAFGRGPTPRLVHWPVPHRLRSRVFTQQTPLPSKKGEIPTSPLKVEGHIQAPSLHSEVWFGMPLYLSTTISSMLHPNSSIRAFSDHTPFSHPKHVPVRKGCSVTVFPLFKPRAPPPSRGRGGGRAPTIFLGHMRFPPPAPPKVSPHVNIMRRFDTNPDFSGKLFQCVYAYSDRMTDFSRPNCTYVKAGATQKSVFIYSSFFNKQYLHSVFEKNRGFAFFLKKKDSRGLVAQPPTRCPPYCKDGTPTRQQA